ncbi:856a7208-edee-425a-8036-ee9d5c0573be [Sclerotinia trifoliorum]|uniref:856a7208-edee-425a-8036-ee9d5c0573be n=1 Tax=Sclerotinia trifoliorum TaxID=28548 RepID=A0A8H2VL96_9HELO|nr:856a7208-edee-425a-8036-ee9d5c0573be [Sclerotinia trifoliorum]
MDFVNESNNLVPSYNYQSAFRDLINSALLSTPNFNRLGTRTNLWPFKQPRVFLLIRSSSLQDGTAFPGILKINQLLHAQADRLSLLLGRADHQADKQGTALKQHKENRQRAHKCTTQECTVDPFKSSRDLRRHQASVHGKPRFFCPVVTCRAHIKGFKRKDNLTEHRRRVHLPVLPSPAVTLETSTQGSQTPSFEDEEMEDWSLAPVQGEMENQSNDNSQTIAFVLRKLLGLHMSLKNIDVEIRALEMTLTQL